MVTLKRAAENPILLPSSINDWEKRAAFNGSVIMYENEAHMFYRALSSLTYYQGHSLSLSTIGYATGKDGIHFSNHRQLIQPELSWEIFGCEDPRITYLDNKFYIFYTALSNYPFNADGIKVGLAIFDDMQTVSKKHLVTPFNAKAMSLFPEKINGKYAVILTANTDLPPSKIGMAFFEKEEDIWNKNFWNNWYAYLDDHTLPLLRDSKDQVEIGAPPLKTDKGWLLIYSYIKNYHSDKKIFGIEAVLLDFENPFQIVGRTDHPLLIPEADYELYGEVPNIVFPSGAIIRDNELKVYYGAADNSCCLASCNLNDLLNEMTEKHAPQNASTTDNLSVKRFEENPVLIPIAEHLWESKAVFNPGAIYEGGKIHLLYRAMSMNNISCLGYASTIDGHHFDERLAEPVYIPREVFEKNNQTHTNYGCEDPRITKINDRIYILYTAYDGVNPPRVAMSSIAVQDFLNKKWQWEIPKLISPPENDDKDACVLPKKVNGKYVFFHRLEKCIFVDYIDDLEFLNGKYLGGTIILKPRPDKWDSVRIGIASVPIETEKGWLMFYHGVDKNGHYKVSACLLDLERPDKVINRLDEPFFSPDKKYEIEGQIRNVVFPCGTVILDDNIFIYYGGGDSVVGVATISYNQLLQKLTK